MPFNNQISAALSSHTAPKKYRCGASRAEAKWFDVIRWSIFTLIQAEEFGINQANLNAFSTTNDPAIARFLGLEGSLGENLGLSNDFASRIIKHVGNYGEIYDRNIGQPFQIDRGLNNLWTEGGLLFAPPFR